VLSQFGNARSEARERLSTGPAVARFAGTLQVGQVVYDKLANKFTRLNDGVAIPYMWVMPFNVPAGTPPPAHLAKATFRLSIPECGIQMQWPATVFPTNTVFPQLAPNVAGQIGLYGAYFVNLDTLGRWLSAPGAGIAAHPGTFTIDLGDGRFGSTSGNFKGGVSDERHSVLVATDPALTADDVDMQLPPNAIMLASPDMQRVNLGTTPIQGTDTVGFGIPLAPGYTAYASIVAATSVADVDNQHSPDNSYRGAAVSVQPTAGRLQTVIQWHIGPGDSLSYRLEWRFEGPTGQRPLRTMRLRGPCDS
jgi:hypothetical protein